MRFGKLFEVIRDGVIVADTETQRISGMRVEDLVPQCLKAQHRAEMASCHQTSRGSYVDSNKLLDVPAVAKTGEDIRVKLSLSSIRSAEGLDDERRFVLALVRDVSERKRAEEEIRRLNEDLGRHIAEGIAGRRRLGVRVDRDGY